MKKLLFLLALIISCASCQVNSAYELSYTFCNDTITEVVCMDETPRSIGSSRPFITLDDQHRYHLYIENYYYKQNLIYTTAPLSIVSFKYIGNYENFNLAR